MADYYINDFEPVLSVDKYSKPLELKDADMATILLIRLILLEPGTFQTHPDMGVGLVSKFRYATDPDIASLNNTIKEQIEKYLPQYSTVTVKCKLDADTKLINIYITSEQLSVILPINTETGEVVETKNDLSSYK